MPDTIAYTAAISAHAKLGEWRDAFKLLEAMKASGVDPNTHTYNTLIAACAGKSLFRGQANPRHQVMHTTNSLERLAFIASVGSSCKPSCAPRHSRATASGVRFACVSTILWMH